MTGQHDRADTGHSLLRIAQDGPVRHISLARSERRNALSRALVAELHAAIVAAGADQATRVVVLTGEGPAFCAGADIGEFVEAAAHGLARSDAEGIVALLDAMVACPLPIVARVHGAAFGGAVGLICAADLAIAAEDVRFALSEARLGLVAAVIAPYVVAALGPREAKARILLGAPFSAAEALRIGLVQQVVAADALDAAIAAAVSDLLRGAPGALSAIKRLPGMVTGVDPATARERTLDLLVERLASAEGQEGLRAFLEKRPAAWVPEEPSSR